MSRITADRVRELFDYSDGRLFWIGGNPNNKHAGVKEAGTINSEGYVVISIDRRKHFAHHLVWLWHGLTLPGKLDHKDRDRANNRLDNLRPAGHATNGYNAKLRTDNKSGVKGVSWCNTYQKWIVQIYHDKQKVSKRFSELQDAIAFVQAKRKELHGEFACEGGPP